MNSDIAARNLPRILALSDPCRLCPRRCGARRLHGERGVCQAPRVPEVFMEYVHWGEDADIAPAHAVCLTGCNLHCRFCQTGRERRELPAHALDPESFRAMLVRRREAGARTVDIFGGEPTVNMPGLFELFAAVGDFPNLVWNTNLYGEAETFELLHGVADIYMADIKFGEDTCAAALSGVADAGSVARRRAGELWRRSPEALIVRHLVMPGHHACCTVPVLEWIADTLPGVRVSLKTVFTPVQGIHDFPENRFLFPEEIKAARAVAERLGLRLTRDPVVPPPSPGQGRDAPDGMPMEILIAPDGTVYCRQVTRMLNEAVEAAIRPKEEERKGVQKTD